jgi:mono/diheme cytochrome c family protein
MKSRSIAFALAAVAALGTVSAALAQDAAPSAIGTAAQGDPDGAFVSSGKFMEPDGEKLYRRVCAACHMPDAMGATGAGTYPALAKNPKLSAGGYPAFVVVKGLNGMPPIGAMMTDQQVADTVNYIRTHFGNKYKDVVKAEDVKALR